MPLHLKRFSAVLGALVAVLVLSAGVAIAGSELESLTEINSSNSDLGSGAIEWSGATYNPVRNVLLTVDDETNAYEFAIGADGTIDDTVEPRVLTLDMGRVDFEGVAWMTGDTYGFLSEGSGEVIVATVHPDNTQISQNDIIRAFPVIAGTWGNLGPEGLAYDGTNFYVTREMPATLTKFDNNGQFVASVDLNHLADASAVAVLADGTYLVASHESRKVAHYDIDWDIESPTLLASRDASTFSQLEGIAVAGTTNVHLFGEDNTRKGQPGQTYSQLQGDLVPPTYAISDVDCSGSLDIGDAMIVARIDVGLLQATPGCGTGDHNRDGTVDLIDALMIAQCQVGLYNIGCPAGTN